MSHRTSNNRQFSEAARLRVFPSEFTAAWERVGYGPLGVELCNNVKPPVARMVYERDDMEGTRFSIILTRSVWKYSARRRSDPLVDCKDATALSRGHRRNIGNEHPAVYLFGSELFQGKMQCPNCGSQLTEPGLSFDVSYPIGATENVKTRGRIRAFTCAPKRRRHLHQFSSRATDDARKCLSASRKSASRSQRRTPGNFIFRTREFEQMEMEYFVRPGEDKAVDQEVDRQCSLVHRSVSSATTRFLRTAERVLAHYAKRTVDIHYRSFPERPKKRSTGTTHGHRQSHRLRPPRPLEEPRGRKANPPGRDRRPFVFRRGRKSVLPYVIEPAAASIAPCWPF